MAATQEVVESVYEVQASLTAPMPDLEKPRLELPLREKRTVMRFSRKDEGLGGQMPGPRDAVVGNPHGVQVSLLKTPVHVRIYPCLLVGPTKTSPSTA